MIISQYNICYSSWSKISKTFPNEEKCRLTDQIIRSYRSVTANIAEGHGRFHYQDETQFVRQARGSLSETLDHQICALDEEYITVSVHCKKTKQTTEWQRNFCCIEKRKKSETHRTFRHICLCLTQMPTLRKAKRAFILPTHPSPPTTHI